MNKRYFIMLLTVVFLSPIFVFSQENNGDLEQLNMGELQQLEEVIRSLEETPSTAQAVSAGNDFNLDLVWKANTLVPHDYAGKALATTLSGVIIQALANVPNPGALNYTWLVDDISSSNDGPDQVGIGRDRFFLVTFQIPEFTHRLRVTAQDPKTERSASASLEIKTILPEVYLYASNNNMFSNLAAGVVRFLSGTEGELLARAFYFNAAGLNDLNFKWFFNNQEQTGGARTEILPVNISARTPAGLEANLKLEILPKNKRANIHERASARTSIYVDK